jgi:hypothetical protein
MAITTASMTVTLICGRSEPSDRAVFMFVSVDLSANCFGGYAASPAA